MNELKKLHTLISKAYPTLTVKIVRNALCIRDEEETDIELDWSIDGFIDVISGDCLGDDAKEAFENLKSGGWFNLHNPSYSAILQAKANDLWRNWDSIPPHIQQMIDALGAYEHGEADAEDIDPNMTDKMLYKVYDDLLDIWAAQS